MKPQVSQHSGESRQVAESGVTEPGLQADPSAAYASDLHPAESGLTGHIRSPANALSRASRARPLASGTKCPYRSTVVVIDL